MNKIIEKIRTNDNVAWGITLGGIGLMIVIAIL
jgi:hypothetical protein